MPEVLDRVSDIKRRMSEQALTEDELQGELLQLLELGVRQASDRMYIESFITDLLVKEDAALISVLCAVGLRMFDHEIEGAKSLPRLKPRWQKGLAPILRKFGKFPPALLMQVRDKFRELFQNSPDYMNDLLFKQFNANIVRACAKLATPAPLTKGAGLPERRQASYQSRRENP